MNPREDDSTNAMDPTQTSSPPPICTGSGYSSLGIPAVQGEGYGGEGGRTRGESGSEQGGEGGRNKQMKEEGIAMVKQEETRR